MRILMKGMLSPNSTCWVLSSPDILQNLSWPGACVGLKICQLVIGQILEGLPNASNIADDFLVHGATKEEHYKSLESTLLLLHKRHLLIQSIHSSVYLVSQNWTTRGIPEKDRFQAIRPIQLPTNVTKARSFLGLINADLVLFQT